MTTSLSKTAKELLIGDQIIECDFGQGKVLLSVGLQVPGDPEPDFYAVILEGRRGMRTHGFLSSNETVILAS